MVRGIQAVALIGAVVFAGLWLVVTVMPKGLERSAIGFVKAQITSELQERFPADGMKAGLQNLSARFGVQSAQLDESLRSDLPELVAQVVSGFCGCEHRSEQEVARAVRSGMKARIASLGAAQTKIAELIKGRYESIIAALRLDMLIFLGTNAIAFFGVLAVTLAPVQKKPLVIYPAVILIAAVVISTSIYLFSTDWFYAILFQNYWGYGYAALMAVIFGFLLDIVVNRARVTLQIVSALPNGLVPVC
jgi:hypothetical protein